MKVYLDLVMILNFLVDFLLLLGTNRLSGFPPQWRRLAGAALFGSVYSGLCLMRGFRFLGNLLWRMVCLCFMGGIAFGWNRSAVKRGGVFVLLSMALGGLAVSFERASFPVLVLAAVGLCLLCKVGLGDGVGQRCYETVTICYGGKTVSMVALRDTGNHLHDPITGEQVMVISGEMASRLTGLTDRQLRDPLGTLSMGSFPGLRLIPYRAVGSSSGMLLALRFENCVIGGRKQQALVAFAPEGFGRGMVYQALTGGVL